MARASSLAEPRRIGKVRLKGGATLSRSDRFTLAVHLLLVTLTAVALLALYLKVEHRRTGVYGLPLDDSWIHFRIAQNLAEGHGFSYNPGEPTTASTAPLWTLSLAALHALTGKWLAPAFIAGGLLLLLTCFVVYGFTWTICRSRGAAFLAALLVAMTAPMQWAALSGMEPPLYTFLALLGLWLHVLWREDTGVKRLLVAGILALAGLARPELLLLFPLALLDNYLVARAWEQPRGTRRFLAAALPAILVFTVLIVPPFFYNHAVTGHFTPASFGAKVSGRGRGLGAILLQGDFHALLVSCGFIVRNFREFMFACAANNTALAILWGLGLVAAADDYRSRERPTPWPGLIFPLVILVPLVINALVAPQGSPGFQNQRYATHLTPLVILTALYGFSWAARRLVWHPKPLVLWLGAALLCLFSLGGQQKALEKYWRNVRDINAMQVQIGLWVRKHTPPGALIATNDIGAIAFFGRRRVLDTIGLATPDILPYIHGKRGGGIADTDEHGLLEYLRLRRPQYLVIFPNWYPWLSSNCTELLEEVHAVELKDNITCGGPKMVVYRCHWERLTSPDSRPQSSKSRRLS